MICAGLVAIMVSVLLFYSAKDKNGDTRFEIVPDIGYNKNVTLKKSFKIKDINVFLINVKKKYEHKRNG